MTAHRIASQLTDGIRRGGQCVQPRAGQEGWIADQAVPDNLHRVPTNVNVGTMRAGRGRVFRPDLAFTVDELARSTLPIYPDHRTWRCWP